MSDLGDSYKELKQQQNSIRQMRDNKFKTELLPLLGSKYDVYEGNNSSFIIDSDKGVIEYFPKSKRLLIRAENKWVTNGDEWLKSNLL